MPAEFARGIDAATYRNGHVYMFRGSQYIRFTGTKMDAGYPKASRVTGLSSRRDYLFRGPGIRAPFNEAFSFQAPVKRRSSSLAWELPINNYNNCFGLRDVTC
jgi:hypothetical protein